MAQGGDLLRQAGPAGRSENGVARIRHDYVAVDVQLHAGHWLGPATSNLANCKPGQRDDWTGDALTKATQARRLDRLHEANDVLRYPRIGDLLSPQAAGELERLAGADRAGHALAAGFRCHEPDRVREHVGQAGACGNRDDPAVAKPHAAVPQLHVVEREVPFLRRQYAAHGAAYGDGGEPARLAPSSGMNLNQLAQAHAEFGLDDPGTRESPVEAQGLGTRRIRCPLRAIRVGPFAHYPRNVDQGLDVVHHGRLTVQPGLRRVWRPHTHLGAAPFNGIQQRRFFSAHITAAATHEPHIERERRTHDRTAEQARFTSLDNRLPDDRPGTRIFGTDKDDSLRGSDRKSAEQQSFEHRMGIVFQQQPVDKGARIPLVPVCNHIATGTRCCSTGAPLAPRRKAGAASPLLTAGFHQGQQHLRSSGECLPETRVDPCLPGDSERSMAAARNPLRDYRASRQHANIGRRRFILRERPASRP